jgi:hypothetical protein
VVALDAGQAPAIAAATGLGVVAAFQLAIALGASLGRASWGGRHQGVLPARLRIASAVAVAVWAFAALVVLGRAGLGPLSGTFLRWATWVLVGALVLGALANAASTSRWERYLWAPLALAEAILVAIVATG